MKKTSLLVKLALGLLVALLVFVSCSDEATVKANTEVTIGATFDAGSKGLAADYGTLDPAEYYWFYKTSVTDAQGNPEVVTAQRSWTTGTSGLTGGQKFSIGKWTLELWAYTGNTTATGLAYYGKARFEVGIDRVTGNVTTTSDFSNDDGSAGYKVYVPMQYVDQQNFDTAVSFTDFQGSLEYDYLGVILSDDETKAAYDAHYGFKHYTTITSLDDPATAVWAANDDTNVVGATTGTSYTSLTADAGTYSITTLYDSLGVFYKVTDTVDIHSNKTVRVTGSFENRERKTFRVYFHDGKILNSADNVSVSSTNAFSGDVSRINSIYNAEFGADFFDGVETTGTDVVPYKDYLFEDVVVLPYVNSTTDTSFKSGYGFLGWYTTDTEWHVYDSNTDLDTNKIRTSGTAINTTATSQTIFVDQVSGTDANFEAAYGLTIAQASADDANTAYAGAWTSSAYRYEIHLYARWVELAKTVGVTTTASDNITLYDTEFGKIGQDGYVHLTIVEGVDHVQGWRNYDDLKFYVGKNDGRAYATTNTDQEYTEYFIDGWYTNGNGNADGKILVITNDGTLARNSDNVQTYIDENGNWRRQGHEVKFFAHWSTRDAE